MVGLAGWLCCGWTVLDALAKQQTDDEAKQRNINLPVTGILARLEMTFKLSTLGLAVAYFLVDVYVLAMLRWLWAAALFLVDADLFLDVRVAWRLLLRVLVDGGSEGFVRLFVTFPSVCLMHR